MFVLAFHERQVKGVSEECWSAASVPLQMPTYKQDRMILHADIGAEISTRRIPATGRLYVVAAAGTVVHTLDYSIPSVRSKIMDQTTATVGQPGLHIGLVRDEELSTDEFPGYDELEKEQWFQLNPTTDQYAVQIKVAKAKPIDRYRSLSRGEYFVYTPIKIILRPPVLTSEGSAAASKTPSQLLALATVVGTSSGRAATKAAPTQASADISSVENL